MSTNEISLNAAHNSVKSVTIFQSSTAELTRTFPVELKAGRNELQIVNISSRVDTESPRIHGLGNDARVFDVSCNVKAAYKNSRNANAVKKALARSAALEAERDIRQRESDVLDDVARSSTREGAVPLDGLMDSFVQRKRNAARAVLELNEQIAQLEEEIWHLKNTHKGETATTVVATVLAKRDCQVNLQLTYLVTGVTWQPYYDLHANTSEGKTSPEVTLLYCANVRQSTGEDWTDTVLTLSTANSQATGSLSIPKVDPLKLSQSQPPPPPRPAGGFGGSPPMPAMRAMMPPAPSAPAPARLMAMSKRSRRGGGSVAGREREPSSDEEFDVIEDDAAAWKNTVLDHSAMSLAYRVEGAVTLPSDGTKHKVSVAVLEFSAELNYVCVPRKTTAAFIEGTVKNTSEYELLAGPVSVFMDDGFVTKTSLGRISVNETFECVLGVDTALRVTYHTKSRTVQEPQRSFAEPTKTTTRTVTTGVSNGHQFDIAGLIVRDAIPLGDEEAHIKVMLRRPDGLAQARDGDEVAVTLGGDAQDVKVRWTKVENGQGGERDGMYEWVCAIPAGKKVNLEAEWDVKAPSNVKWEEGTNMGSSRKD